MPRNISFAMTTQQFRDRTKDVTRWLGWWTTKPGDVLCGVEKGMGLKKGEKVVRLGLIEVVSARSEPLDSITAEDVVREGFPDWTREQFIEFFMAGHKCHRLTIVRRLEYKYL